MSRRHLGKDVEDPAGRFVSVILAALVGPAWWAGLFDIEPPDHLAEWRETFAKATEAISEIMAVWRTAGKMDAGRGGGHHGSRPALQKADRADHERNQPVRDGAGEIRQGLSGGHAVALIAPVW